MSCAGIISSTVLNFCLCFEPPAVTAGFLVEAAVRPECVVVGSIGCRVVEGCEFRGEVMGGCYGLSKGGNWLFDVVATPVPGEVFYVSFE